MKKQAHLSPYWQCQLAGWTITALYWEVDAFVRSPTFSYAFAALNLVADIGINLLLTDAYRRFALQQGWQRLRPRELAARLIPAVMILAICFTLAVTLRFYRWGHYPLSYLQYLHNSGWVPFTTGVRTMAVWVLAWHLYHYAQQRNAATRENARLQVLAREIQLYNLSAQLNPHFFFNSLNNIKSLVPEDPALARRAIDLLSDLLRNALYKRSDQLVPLHEEMSLVSDYLELEKLRFEDRLQVDLHIDPALTGIGIPPLSIQALVENAIKHGIDHSMEGGCIVITVTKEGTHIHLSVQNPGTLASSHSKGLGLRNLRERLQLQFQGRAAFQIRELPEAQVLSVITIPA
ncbi:sensor histidine kinase [Chitinophaga qingshengii]|uniref:Histidine kinase n=1 Tax=Chitinophaga qingshengii TaxID=1569794 RepID=A0ABR7TNT1_9BACT|nr:histidine kinase [Chitinophaga qingshengii]MBC9932132.1 histidine kinase [Chitinophaga qingshengii]